MSWLVVRKNLRASTFRQDVQTTEIAMAFPLEETGIGKYKPHLSQQPVFAFLPLRNYGLKFIIQGDFVLPSSREEVDGNSAWNQWLLSELPALFVNAVHSFCALPCFQENQGNAVLAYMSFVPLIGEVNGFFSHLPHLIISKLRMSNCLLLDGPDSKWVLPCRVLRGWNEQARILLSDVLLQKHLGLGYLSKDVVLPDSLAKTLGIQDYGPKVLVDIISAICCTDDGISSLGLDWLSCWLDALYSTLLAPSGYSLHVGVEYDLINNLRKVPFIPLSNGRYSSLANGPIWLPCDSFSTGSDGKHSPSDFPMLYAKLRTVNPLLLSAATTSQDMQETRVDNVIKMLQKIGVQQLSAHDVIKSHILVTLSNDTFTNEDGSLMVEYLSFIMLHFQYTCANCQSEKANIISELRKKPVLLTSDGYMSPDHEPIHFGKEYGNLMDIDKLTDKMVVKWLELDISYLKHPITQSLSSGLVKWRKFFQQLGVTDFVQVKRVDKRVPGTPYEVSDIMRESRNLVVPLLVISDWESPELVNLLTTFSSKKCRVQCMYLLEILDKMWDDYYHEKTRCSIISEASESNKVSESSFLKSIHEFQWIASSMDRQLHYPKELFYDCEEVRSILGTWAPYAVPKVTSKLLLNDIGFKTQVSLDDALGMLHSWRLSNTSFKASLVQMAKLYTYISDGVAHSKVKITEELIQSSFIFVPFPSSSKYNDAVPGIFMSPKELYWHDPTGCVDKTQEMIRLCSSLEKTSYPPCGALANIYPSLHDFFVNKCGVHYLPSFGSYIQILVQLSTVALPSQSAHVVFQVLLKWADDLKFGSVKPEEISNLKQKLGKLENTVFPTFQDKWVSLHPSFGIICWSDDEELKQQFKHSDGIDLVQFGELNNEEKNMLSGKIAVLFQNIGVPALSEIVSREAIIYGAEDNRDKASLINWILPFAQRYIRKLYPDVYLKMKQFGLENLNQLKVIVVEKLFYKYTLRGRDSATKKRFECSCLLQGNILYASRTSDTHSMFLELSRLFFAGTPELHLANFLHMVTSMAESGATSDQTEFFIANTQKVPELPQEESVWSLSSLHELHEGEIPTSLPSPMVKELKTPTHKRKPGISPSWPPTDWRTAPGFPPYRQTHFQSRAGPTLSEMETRSEDLPIAVEVEGDWVIEEGSKLSDTVQSKASETAADLPRAALLFDPTAIPTNSGSEHTSGVDVSVRVPEFGVPNFPERDRIFGQAGYEQLKTGRIGEIIAHKYFVEKMGLSNVRWVNSETETGLPYDLVVEDTEGSRQYIEVKSTRYSSKGWFEMSAREWQFASECGDSFSIAHVLLLGPNKATVTVLNNPVKLCQRNLLQLAVLMSRQLLDSSATLTTN